MPIFYVDDERIDSKSAEVEIVGNDARHLARSLRVKEGETILAGDARGSCFLVRVTRAGPESVSGLIESSWKSKRELPRIVLFQAFSRPTKMDEAIVRAAESGAGEIVPFLAPRSESGAGRKVNARMERWKRLSIEASKLSRRAWPLSVGEPLGWPLPRVVMDGQDLNLVLWEDEERNTLGDVEPEGCESVGIFVGPEGGFSPEDVDIMKARGAKPVRLGNLIMRTESAGSYAVILLRNHFGFLDDKGR